MADNLRVPYENRRSALVAKIIIRSPHVTPSDTKWMHTMLELVLDVSYPVRSAGDLVEHFGGKDSMLTIGSRRIWPAKLLATFPPYYFPISSVEDFIDKTAYIRKLRSALPRRAVRLKQPLLYSQIEKLRAQLPPILFPIRTSKELLRSFEQDRPYDIDGRTITAQQIADHVPSEIFPIESVNALLRIVSSLLSKGDRSRSARLTPTVGQRASNPNGDSKPPAERNTRIRHRARRASKGH